MSAWDGVVMDEVGCAGLVVLAVLVAAVLLALGIGFVRLMESPL